MSHPSSKIPKRKKKIKTEHRSKSPRHAFINAAKKKKKNEVYQNPVSYTFMHGNKRLSGVHKLLEEWYYPNFTLPRPRSYTSSSSNEVKDPGAKFGLLRGCKVDHQVTKWIKGAVKAYPYEHKLPDNSHFSTKRFVAVLDHERWKPVNAQLTVSHLEAGIATAVDAVVKDKDENIILIENKVGFENTFELVDPKRPIMIVGEKNIPNSPKNHAFLQLIFTKLLYIHSGFPPPIQCYVIRIGVKGVELYPLPSWTEEAEMDLSMRIISRIHPSKLC